MLFYANVLIFVLSVAFIYVLRENAEKWGLIDVPNDRSTHYQHTARGAGIGFFPPVIISLLIFIPELFLSHLWTFVALIMIFAIGVLDDHRDTSPKTKFVIITFATILLYFDGIVIDNLGVFLGTEITLGWFALPFTIIAVIGFTNALNLIDGLDGLAGSISIVILLGFFIVGYRNDDLLMISLSSFFIVALLAFLIFNWHPASIFMGDSGSLVLGFVISILAIQSLNYIPVISILFITAIPNLDTLVVMIRRIRNHHPILKADRCHLHHVLRHFFAEDTPKTVFFLAIVQIMYTITGLQLENNIDEFYLLVLFILNVIIFYLLLSAMIKRQKRKC